MTASPVLSTGGSTAPARGPLHRRIDFEAFTIHANTRSYESFLDGNSLASLFIEGYGHWMTHSGYGIINYREDPDDRTSRVLHRPGLVVGDASNSNPSHVAGKTLTWRGQAVSNNLGGTNFITGTSRVTLDLDPTPMVDVLLSFDDTSSIGFGDVDVVNGRFDSVQIESDGTPLPRFRRSVYLHGSFFGPNHEEVGGVFRTEARSGAFGGKRE